MKKLTLTLAAVGFAGLSAAGALAGHHEEGDKANWEAEMAEKFAATDANADGAIDIDEYLAKKAEGGEEFDEAEVRTKFAEAAGEDGKLSLDEAKAAHKKQYEAKKSSGS